MPALPILKVVDLVQNPDEVFLTKGLLIDKFKIWGNNMVKAAKEYSQWAAPVLLTVLLGFSIYTSHQQSISIDQLSKDVSRLQTQKEDAEKYATKETDRISNIIFQLDRESIAHREQTNKEIAELKEALKSKAN